MMKKLLLAALAAGLLAACIPESGLGPEQQADGHITINAMMQDYIPATKTRSVINPADYSCTWKEGDEIGMFSNRIGGETQTPSQLGFKLAGGDGTGTAVFTGGNGWRMETSGEYNYVAYYPYNAKYSRDCIVLDYTGQTQVKNNSTDHLCDYDFMYSTVLSPTSGEPSLFSFSHVNALVNFKLSIPEGCRDYSFGKVRISAGEDLFTEKAEYGIQSIIDNGQPEIKAIKKTDSVEVIFDEDGIVAVDGEIDVWMMMFPSNISGKDITVELYDSRFSAVPLLEGSLMAESDQQASTVYKYNAAMKKTGRILPKKPACGENLNILLFGHSFGKNCTQFLPEILKSANIDNVYLGRFYRAGCTLMWHYEFLQGDFTNVGSVYSFEYCYPGNTIWKSNTDYINGFSIKSVIEGTPWDIILFQDSPGNSTNYSKSQPYLDYLIDYVTETCERLHGKRPVIGWNLLWSYSSSYDAVASSNSYSRIVTATQLLIDDTGIELVVPSGTAMENARRIYSDISYQLITDDGAHASNGIGRYVTACTWFEKIIAPIYGVSILGNTYRPTEYSFEGDQVTDANAAVLQRCAIAAVEHPFEVTQIESGL